MKKKVIYCFLPLFIFSILLQYVLSTPITSPGIAPTPLATSSAGASKEITAAKRTPV